MKPILRKTVLSKIRKMAAIALFAAQLLGMMAPANGAETAVDVPDDFAYGIPLSIEGNAPFYQVTLPEEVYLESAWPDLRDIRIFNGKGDAVPFSLQLNNNVEEKREIIPLQIFPLEEHATSRSESAILYRSANGLNITVPVSDPTQHKAKKTFLLVRPENEKSQQGLSKLHFEWPELKANWQGKVSITSSDDLKNWTEVAIDAPLMDVKSGEQHLQLNEVDFTEGYLTRGDRYFLVEFSDEKTTPILFSSAKGIVIYQEQQKNSLKIEMFGQTITSREAEYNWPTPQPLSELSILPLTENTVFPIQIAYRSSMKDPWQPMGNKMVFRTEREKSQPIEMKDKLVQGIKITGINTQWGDNLPVVEGFRDTYTLTFNAQGNAPYLLAWGAKSATKQALDYEQLVPESLRNDDDELPTASIQTRIDLGGKARLSELSLAERTSMWQKILLWILLIAGAAGLAFLAFKIWREVQQKTD